MVIKTDYEKEIGVFVPSKFENTEGMKLELEDKNYIGKMIPDLLYFYWLDNKIITCKWKHKINPMMSSNNQMFLWINGLRIYNDRSHKDYALIGDTYLEGMQI